MDKLLLYIKESYYELTEKVTWPTWSNLLATTRLVLIASVIIVLIVFLFDSLSNQILSFIYELA